MNAPAQSPFADFGAILSQLGIGGGDKLASGVGELQRRKVAAAKHAVAFAESTDDGGVHPLGYLKLSLAQAEHLYRELGGDPSTVDPDWVYAFVNTDATDAPNLVHGWTNVPVQYAHRVGNRFEASITDVRDVLYGDDQ